MTFMASISPLRVLEASTRRYHAAPLRFGRYDLLLSSSAMDAYPYPWPVSGHIPRPDYVPETFWTDPWAGVSVVKDPEEEARIKLGGKEERGLREVARMAAKVLSQVGALVKVRRMAL
jgi:methionyl aminopeptidase